MLGGVQSSLSDGEDSHFFCAIYACRLPPYFQVVFPRKRGCGSLQRGSILLYFQVVFLRKECGSTAVEQACWGAGYQKTQSRRTNAIHVRRKKRLSKRGGGGTPINVSQCTNATRESFVPGGTFCSSDSYVYVYHMTTLSRCMPYTLYEAQQYLVAQKVMSETLEDCDGAKNANPTLVVPCRRADR